VYQSFRHENEDRIMSPIGEVDDDPAAASELGREEPTAG
jgi:hypothetical protein